MSTRAFTLGSVREVANFLNENHLGWIDVVNLGYNGSGHVEFLYDPVDPTGVSAGAGAIDVEIPEFARLQRIRVTASGGNTTLNILDKGVFTILDGSTFEIDWAGRYLGDGTADASNVISIGANSLYFVSWLDRS